MTLAPRYARLDSREEAGMISAGGAAWNGAPCLLLFSRTTSGRGFEDVDVNLSNGD